jgi:SpoVK/Ycf46/Vps4 family AAA+-type ATPase
MDRREFSKLSLKDRMLEAYSHVLNQDDETKSNIIKARSCRKLLIQMEDFGETKKSTYLDFQEIMCEKYNEASRRNFEDKQGRLSISGLEPPNIDCFFEGCEEEKEKTELPRQIQQHQNAHHTHEQPHLQQIQLPQRQHQIQQIQNNQPPYLQQFPHQHQIQNNQQPLQQRPLIQPYSQQQQKPITNTFAPIKSDQSQSQSQSSSRAKNIVPVKVERQIFYGNGNEQDDFQPQHNNNNNNNNSNRSNNTHNIGGGGRANEFEKFAPSNNRNNNNFNNNNNNNNYNNNTNNNTKSNKSNQSAPTAFSTARAKLDEDDAKQGKVRPATSTKRKQNSFVVPTKDNDEEKQHKKQKTEHNEYEDNPIYKNVDPMMIERIMNEILTTNLNIRWTDIAGLEDVKQVLNEMIILPHRRPELFTGLRQPPRGLLLFGPPGNGKTMIAKAVATEANLTFFAISASSLTSKWIGDGEKMVKALFAVARDKQPSFIFIDEIDSILTSRGSEEHESTRRLKTEFLLQFDGATSAGEGDRITVMGATNRPQDLDEAARRRLTKRIYVPLPEPIARKRLIENLIKKENHALDGGDLDSLANVTTGFSGNDLSNLCCDAAMGPLRETNIEDISLDTLRPLAMSDFENSLKKIRPSVSTSECVHYEDWNIKFGSSSL